MDEHALQAIIAQQAADLEALRQESGLRSKRARELVGEKDKEIGEWGHHDAPTVLTAYSALRVWWVPCSPAYAVRGDLYSVADRGLCTHPPALLVTAALHRRLDAAERRAGLSPSSDDGKGVLAGLRVHASGPAAVVPVSTPTPGPHPDAAKAEAEVRGCMAPLVHIACPSWRMLNVMLLLLGFFFLLIHRSHSIRFTRAQGIPKYMIGFGRGMLL